MKRIVCFFLSLLLLVGVLSGFAEAQKTALTGFIVIPEGTDRKALKALLDEVAAAADVSVSWQAKSEKEWAKEKRFTGVNLPDILLNAATAADIAAQPELFMELGFLSFRHAPDLQGMFSDEPDTLALASDREERIFSLPGFLGAGAECEAVMFINRAWLQKLNLAMPQTFSDLSAVLTAFRDNDCNGNGDPSDEIPLDYCGWFGSPYSLTNLIGSWGVQLTNGGADGFFAENGEVKNYAVDERYRALLLYASGLYAQGLVYPKDTRNEEGAYVARSHGNRQGSAVVGIAMGTSAEAQFGEQLKDQYVPLPPMDNSVDMLTTSEARWSYDSSGLNIRADRACISAGCQAPEAAMRFLNAFYRPEYSEKTLRSGFADLLPLYIPRYTAAALTPEKDAERAERQPYADALSNLDMVTEYYPQEYMNYTAQEQAAMDVLLENVTRVTEYWWPRFLSGKADVAAEWDQYVAQVYAAGLPELLSIRQRAYEAYQGK